MSPMYPKNQMVDNSHHGSSHMNQSMSLVHHNFSCFSNSNIPTQTSLPIVFHQHTEIDHYIRSQNEKLRIILQEQRKQHVGELLKKVEWNALHMLKKKDEEMAEATKKSTELKAFLTRLEVENESWRKEAEEKEAMVFSLHKNIEEMKERGEDAESCCDENRLWGGSGGVKEVQLNRKRTIDCKCCNSQKSCFMFLPCRHLCSCKTCEPFLQLCPVCSMPKKSTIETLIV